MHGESWSHIYLEPLWETLHVTFFVMVVMMLMEFVELYRMRRKKDSGWIVQMQGRGAGRHGLQLLMAAALGLIPGCVGGFMAVSLYAHRMLSFGAVLTASFTALGDDAFRMLASEPWLTLKVEAILFGMGMLFGWIVDKIGGERWQLGSKACHIELHDADQEGDGHHPHAHKENGATATDRYWPALKDWSFARTLLVVLLLFYMASLLGGVPGHEHGHEAAHGFHLDFENGLFLLLSLTALILVIFSNEHFLQEHLWNHLLKKHFPSIFLWTLGTLYLITLLQHHIDLGAWVSADLSHIGLMLLAAILIGWIPQSGPHYLFIQLYFTSAIPFGVFFANAIVQDGHTSLLLLAESRRRYVLLKSLKSLIALVCGIALLYLM